MGLLTVVKALIGGGDNVKKGMDLVGKGIDMAIFTSEEKSLANMKVLEWKLSWIKATGAQSVARRFIAYLVTGLWISLVALACFLHLVGWVDKSDFLFETLRDVINPPFMIIVAFYFIANITRK